MAVAGLVSDANRLTELAQKISGKYLEEFGEVAPPEYLCQRIGDIMQNYTQTGGLRPFGVCLMFAGYTKEKKFQLLTLDPSGNYCEYKAHSCGQNSLLAQNIIKQKSEKINDMTLAEGLSLASEVIIKCTDLGKKIENIHMATFTVSENICKFRVLKKEVKQKLINAAIKKKDQ